MRQQVGSSCSEVLVEEAETFRSDTLGDWVVIAKEDYSSLQEGDYGEVWVEMSTLAMVGW